MHQLVRIMWRFSLAFIFFELPTFLKLLRKSILKEAARKSCSQIMLWITFLSLIRSRLGQIWVPLLRFSCKSMFSCKPEKVKIHFFEGHLRVSVRSLFFPFFLGLFMTVFITGVLIFDSMLILTIFPVNLLKESASLGSNKSIRL